MYIITYLIATVTNNYRRRLKLYEPEIHGCMQQPLALVSKEIYFWNMKYLKIVVIFTLSILEKMKIISFNHKIYNLLMFFGYSLKMTQFGLNILFSARLLVKLWANFTKKG